MNENKSGQFYLNILLNNYTNNQESNLMLLICLWEQNNFSSKLEKATN